MSSTFIYNHPCSLGAVQGKNPTDAVDLKLSCDVLRPQNFPTMRE